jgi:GABA(A) receptor-associated protein
MSTKNFLFSFMQSTPMEKRKADAQRLQTKYPTRVAVVVGANSNTAPQIKTHKFLVPKDLTYGQFMYTIRMRLQKDTQTKTALQPEEGFLLFVVRLDEHDGTLIHQSIPSMNETIGRLHHVHSVDGYLYIQYAIENTFG